jgi:SAM-dependent methyltransferase
MALMPSGNTEESEVKDIKEFTQPQKWPKKVAVLSPEREAIRDDFMRSHLEAMQTKWYGIIGHFDNRYALKSYFPGCKTLEIGAGIGEHLNWEKYQTQEYHAIEMRKELSDRLKELYPDVNAVTADVQERMPFEDEYFDRVIAIHVLEHLPDLPRTLKEIWRVMKKEGKFSVVIPCEGAWAYNFARNISARRHFEKKYKESYDWFVAAEHLSTPKEIIDELKCLFIIKHMRYFPLLVPIININLTIGLTLIKKDSIGS